MTAIRSAVYNVLFYVTMIVAFIVITPVYFFLPQPANMAVVSGMAKTLLWLLRVVCGTKAEFRGLENIPTGPVVIASKHQSLWETFALLTVIRNPGVVIKRQLLYVPIWGWWAWKARMIYVTRGAGSAALKEITEGAKRVLAEGRPVIIFPEGTRKAPGAPPDVKYGIVHLYGKLGVPVVPVALNSGFYWPRRRFLRFPGTIVVEFLPSIAPGLSSRAFLTRLTETVEAGVDRLIVEADAGKPRPPFPPEAEARLSELRQKTTA
ncbi:MAG: 1-acyl-sn-glycerol-3-phosphate acyltransferase [Bauldia sp.]|nr:1-acyl-sn-glycerol-3-phosphate acyltransferase [Bauldia sp.]